MEPGLEQVFPGESDLAQRMRALDWSKTPLGPVHTWSRTLRMMVSFLLANRFPLLLWWGPDYIQLYNDAYRPVLGAKHPQSVGQPTRECWAEIWHVIGPLIDTPFHGGPATWMDDLALEINRHGFVEETHFTVAYSPVPDPEAPGGIGGVLATVHEITQQVIQKRRIRMLRDLGARSAAARTVEEACAVADQTFAQNPKDAPFAIIYLIDAERKTARLAGAIGVAAGSPAAPNVVRLDGSDEAGWPMADVNATERMAVVKDLAARLTEVPPGPWADPPRQAVVLPIPSNIQHRPAGMLVIGVSAQIALDDLYRSYLELGTAQLATAIANARAYEEAAPPRGGARRA